MHQTKNCLIFLLTVSQFSYAITDIDLSTGSWTNDTYIVHYSFSPKYVHIEPNKCFDNGSSGVFHSWGEATFELIASGSYGTDKWTMKTNFNGSPSEQYTLPSGASVRMVFDGSNTSSLHDGNNGSHKQFYLVAKDGEYYAHNGSCAQTEKTYGMTITVTDPNNTWDGTIPNAGLEVLSDKDNAKYSSSSYFAFVNKPQPKTTNCTMTVDSNNIDLGSHSAVEMNNTPVDTDITTASSHLKITCDGKSSGTLLLTGDYDPTSPARRWVWPELKGQLGDAIDVKYNGATEWFPTSYHFSDTDGVADIFLQHHLRRLAVITAPAATYSGAITIEYTSD